MRTRRAELGDELLVADAEERGRGHLTIICGHLTIIYGEPTDLAEAKLLTSSMPRWRRSVL